MIYHVQLEDFRSSGDHLGQVKNLGQHNSNRPADMPFGRPSVVDRAGGRPRLSAKEVMRGTYVVEDDVSDMDRGRRSRPGTSRDGTGVSTISTFSCPLRDEYLTHESTADPDHRYDEKSIRDLI